MPIDLTRLAPTRFTTMPIILPNCSCRCLATADAADELQAWPSATPAERPARAQGNVGLPTNQLRFLKNRWRALILPFAVVPAPRGTKRWRIAGIGILA